MKNYSVVIDELAAWNLHRKQLECFTREQELFAMHALPGKTPTPNFVQQLIEGWADESRRNTEREETQDLRPRWLSLRILQLTGVDTYVRSSETKMQILWGTRGAGKTARFAQLSHSLPQVQFFSARQALEALLPNYSDEDWTRLEDRMAQSRGISEKKT